MNGNIDITGDLQTVVMPALTNVTGSVNIQSTVSTFQCPFPDGVVQGGNSFVCEGGVANPVPLAVDNSTTNTSLVVVTASSVPSITASSETPSASASATGSSQKSSASVTMAYGLVFFSG